MTPIERINLGLAIAVLRDTVEGKGNPKRNAQLALHHLREVKEVRDLIDQVIDTLEKN